MDATPDADVEVLRDALAPMRFPLLLSAVTWGLMVVANAVGPLIGFGLALSNGYLAPVVFFQIALVLALHGLALVPPVLLLRAAIAGFQSREDPSRLVVLARLHERAWNWIGALGALLVAFVFLAVVLVAC